MDIYSPRLLNFTFLTNINTITGSYTIQPSDKESLILCSGSSSTNITVTGSFNIGTVIPILRYTPSAVNIISGSGVTIRQAFGNSILTQYNLASVMCLSENEWLLYGDL
jgi:hypothetical protein